MARIMCIRELMRLGGFMGTPKAVHVARSVAAAEAARKKYSNCAAAGMKVAVCGAAGNTGQPLSLLLKQSPLIDQLALYDVSPTCGCGMELGHVDTKCDVTSYSGICKLCDALKGARVAVIVAKSPEGDSFDNNAPIVSCLAAHICDACPTAMTVVATEPVESMVPLVAEIQRARGVYDPRRLVGVSEHQNMRANLVLSDFIKVSPEEIKVLVVGGCTPNTMVPVLSGALHPANLTQDQYECVTAMILGCAGAESGALSCSSGACLSGAYAIARTVVNVVKALSGRSNVVQSAYVDTDCKFAPGCHFLNNEVLLGSAGIEKSLGIPHLSPFENCLFVNSLPYIKNEICKAEWTVAAMCADPCTYAHLFPRQCSANPCVCCTNACCCGMNPCCCRVTCGHNPICRHSPCPCCGQDPCCCNSDVKVCCWCNSNPCKCPKGTCKCCGTIPCSCNKNLSCVMCTKPNCCCASACTRCGKSPCCCDGNSLCCRCGKSPCCCDKPCCRCGKSPCCCDAPCAKCGKNPCCCSPLCASCGVFPCACPKIRSKEELVCALCGKFPCLCVRAGCVRGRTYHGSQQPVCLCSGWDWDKKPSQENMDHPKEPCPCCYPQQRWEPRAKVVQEECEHQISARGPQCGACKRVPAYVRCLEER